jgi:hypothetical protein
VACRTSGRYGTSRAAGRQSQAVARVPPLHQHLPDWQPAGLIHTRELAEQTWPDLSNYDLDHPSSPEPGRGGGALTEAHRIALLLDTLVHDLGRVRPASRTVWTGGSGPTSW